MQIRTRILTLTLIQAQALALTLALALALALTLTPTLTLTLLLHLERETVAFQAGTADDKICQLCLEAEEDAIHMWCCCKLKGTAKEMDNVFSAIDPQTLSRAMLIGIVPAMWADPRRPFWGENQMGSGIMIQER